MQWRKGDFIISTNKKLLNLEYIHEYLSGQSYWAEGIPMDVVKKCIKGSFCFAVFYKGSQLGFARVITDKATFAYLADVFIDEKFRKQGLAKWLMKIILNHRDLQGLRSIMLATRDAHELYRKFGFTGIDNPERYMRKHNPEVYKKNANA